MIVLGTSPLRFICADEPAHTSASCDAPVNVGGAFTLSVTVCVNNCEQLGDVLVVVILVTCNV